MRKQSQMIKVMLLAGAVAFAFTLSGGLGTWKTSFQLLAFAATAPLVAWFELDGPRRGFAKVAARTVIASFWLISISVVVSVLLLEAVLPLATADWHSRITFGLLGLGTAASLGFACSPEVIGGEKPTTWKRLLGLIAATIVSYIWNNYATLEWLDVLLIPSIVVCLHFVYRSGQQLAKFLKPAAESIEPIYEQLSKMTGALLTVTVGYVLSIFLFTGIYSAIYKADSDSFAGAGLHVGDPPLADRSTSRFIHLSVATATTLGYGDIYPAKPLARLATGFQVIFSVAWTIIVFAAAMEAAKKPG